MERRQFLSMTLGAAALIALPASVRAADFRKAKPTVWTAHSVNDAITAMYGKTVPIEKGVTLNAPDVAANGGAIPVNVISDIKNAKTVSIFQDANPEAAVIVFDINEYSIINYDIKIKMKASGTITAIVETTDGKLYLGKKTLEVALGGCEG